MGSLLIHQCHLQRDPCQVLIEILWSDRTSWGPLIGRVSSPTRTRIARQPGPHRPDSLRIRFQRQKVTRTQRKYSPKLKAMPWLKTGRPLIQTLKSINSLHRIQNAWLVHPTRNMRIPCIVPDLLRNLSITKPLSLTRATKARCQRASDRPSWGRCSHNSILK